MTALTFEGYAVAALVAAVGQELGQWREAGRVSIVTRGPEGPVTSADLHAQEMLISGLTTLFGPAVFVAEEGAQRYTQLRPETSAWIIDPLDGTSGYLAGGRRYGVQVAAFSAGNVVGAWICCPDLAWSLSAWEGSPLHIDALEVLGDSDGRILIADGDFDRHHLDTLRDRGVFGYRRSSSCAVDYCQLITGQLDIAMYRRTHPWDHAPGAYLAGRAGAQSLRWSGKAYHPADGELGILTVAAGIDPDDARRRLVP